MKFWKKAAAISLVFLCSGCRMEAAENHINGTVLDGGRETNGKRAESIKTELEKIKGITGSAVLVEGHTTIIGLRLENADRNQTKAAIARAEQAAKTADTAIQHVSVTTKESIVHRIEKEEKKRQTEG